MESKLQKIQKMIADPDFRYGGNSMDIMVIVDAIKSGYRLCRVEELQKEIRERIKIEVDNMCEESIGVFDLLRLSSHIQSIIREKTK